MIVGIVLLPRFNPRLMLLIIIGLQSIACILTSSGAISYMKDCKMSVKLDKNQKLVQWCFHWPFWCFILSAIMSSINTMFMWMSYCISNCYRLCVLKFNKINLNSDAIRRLFKQCRVQSKVDRLKKEGYSNSDTGFSEINNLSSQCFKSKEYLGWNDNNEVYVNKACDFSHSLTNIGSVKSLENIFQKPLKESSNVDQFHKQPSVIFNWCKATRFSRKYRSNRKGRVIKQTNYNGNIVATKTKLSNNRKQIKQYSKRSLRTINYNAAAPPPPQLHSNNPKMFGQQHLDVKETGNKYKPLINYRSMLDANNQFNRESVLPVPVDNLTGNIRHSNFKDWSQVSSSAATEHDIDTDVFDNKVQSGVAYRSIQQIRHLQQKDELGKFSSNTALQKRNQHFNSRLELSLQHGQHPNANAVSDTTDTYAIQHRGMLKSNLQCFHSDQYYYDNRYDKKMVNHSGPSQSNYQSKCTPSDQTEWKWERIQ
ncbi:hypothetical protein GJ496_004310 [Pomphorhynchus laevis]|nr:hypothetical protein GJ496_004310 [Pomphorhynchus laevis]